MTHAQPVEPLVVVYQATNRVNGHRYIGFTARGLTRREKAHRAAAGSGATKYLLHKALRKYGGENFVFEVLADFQDDEELAKAYECEAIAAYKPEYNLTYGGEGGTLAEESRKKIGDANRGRKMPPSHKAKRIAFLTGRKHTPETRAKMSAVQKGHAPTRTGPIDAVTRAKISAANKGKTPWIQGKKHSEETKEKIRAQRWKHTPESLARIKSARHKAWSEPTEAMKEAVRVNGLRAIAATRKPVQCVEDGQVFPGCSDADRFYGYRIGLVSRIVKGTVPNKTGRTFVRYEVPK